MHRLINRHEHDSLNTHVKLSSKMDLHKKHNLGDNMDKTDVALFAIVFPREVIKIEQLPSELILYADQL